MDSVLEGLARAIAPAIARPSEMSRLFADHVFPPFGCMLRGPTAISDSLAFRARALFRRFRNAG
jgi:hypothetical protein